MAETASSLTSADGTVTLRLLGDVGQSDADHLQPLVADVMHRDFGVLVIDLSQCTYLDPAGVDLVGEVMGAAVERGAPISMAGASPNVRIILGIAGLLDLAGDGPGDSTS